MLKALLPRPKEERDETGISEEDIDGKVVDAVCSRLAEGQIGILPTETVYGLVGNAKDDSVVERIYAAKGRDPGKALPVWVFRWEDVAGLGVAVSEHAEKLARNFWPGPLTLVLPFLGASHCRWQIAPTLLKQWSEKKSVAVRIPDHPFARSVLRHMASPLIATSANRSGQAPATLSNPSDAVLRSKVDWIVDAGPSVFGRESSVVLCDEGGWRILREGALRGVMIQKALEQVKDRV